MKEAISARQTAIIASIMIFANKILTLPSLLYEKSKADAIFVIILMFLTDFLVLYIFSRLKNKYPSNSFYEILKEKLGGPFAITVYILFFAYYFIKLLINFNYTHVYFKLQVYHDDQESVFLFVSIVIMIATMARGLRPLARTFEFFYFIILFGFLAVMFVSLSNLKNMLVLFDSPISEIFVSSYKYAFAFGDFLFLFLVMEKIDLKQNNKGLIVKYVLFAMFVVIVGYSLFYSVYENTVFMHPNAISDIIVLSYQIFNIGRLEFIPVFIVMLQTFLQISVYAYILGKILQTIFKKMTLSLSVFIVVLLFLSMYLLFFNNLDIIEQTTIHYVPILALILQYILPFICFILSFKRRKVWKKHLNV